MNLKFYRFIVILCALPSFALAQKNFTEGTITYSVSISSPIPGSSERKEYKGTYIVTLKQEQVRKELKLNGGYQDIVIYNNDANTIYSLKVAGDKKFAIQLGYDDFLNKQKQYKDFLIREENGKKKLAGYTAHPARVAYRDGSTTTIYYTPELIPNTEYVFERFPGIKVLPLDFIFTNPDGVEMHFHAEKIEVRPVENSFFRVPTDYKIIRYSEYKQLNN